MRNIYVLLFSMLTIAVFGQPNFNIGIKGAVTMNNLSGDLEDYERAAKVGFQAGAFVRLGDEVHLQPEAYFASRAGEASFTYGAQGNTVEATQNINLSTLDVPVLLGYKVINTDPMNIRVQAGPVASFVLNKDLEFDSGGGVITENPFNDEDFNDVNWALQLGAGVDFLFLTLDIRYEYGLNTIYDKPDNMNVDPTFKHNIWFVSLGWKFL